MIGKNENPNTELPDEYIESHKEREDFIERVKEETYSRYELDFEHKILTFRDLVDKVSMEIISELGDMICIDEARSFLRMKLQDKINDIF